ncbi:putative odorant receptor 69a isoform X2 [Drosophila simulans]|nr:putative odorant receptor 69a isoform X2 [Drosophila simulans]
MIPRFKWSQRSAEEDLYPTFRRAFFLLGSFCLAYQCIGVIIDWSIYGRKAADTQSFVAEISEATGALMLVAVGFFNICVLSNRRPEIEILLTDLRELYPRPRDRNYRQQYYFQMANGLMKFEFIYFWMFTMYYNIAPLVVMMYEYQMDGMEMRYKTQINTWYPWNVYGSAIGYGVGHFATLIASIEGVAFSLGTHNIISIITYQLKLHFDAISNQLLKLDSRHPGANQELRRLIAYHSHVIQIANDFNEIMNFSFLGGLFFSTTALCMTSVAIVLLDLQSAIKCINGLIAFIVYNFVICFLGTEFTLASGKVLPAAFYNNWYEGDLAYRRMLLILMMRATKPYMWRTYKLAPVSITTYMATLKFSYQMFTCVRSLK